MDNIKILITIDKNYIFPFKVMLRSFFINNPVEDSITIYLLHSSIPQADLDELQEYCLSLGATLIPIQFDKELFENARVSERYPQEMYYRLLAPHVLPQKLDKILYLDPDVLIINPLRPLWEVNLDENVFAAAAHTAFIEASSFVNHVRLGTDHVYFNSGVILIDLVKARLLVKTDEVFRYVEEFKDKLIFPDQDVFNALYGKYTLAVEDVLWNYDARNYFNFLIRSTGKHNMNWVMQNTAILHFCGKNKPWNPSYDDLYFGVLYKHYMTMTTR